MKLRLDTEKRVKLDFVSGVQLLVFPPIGTNQKDYTKMHAIFHPLLSLIAHATESQLAEYVEYLKTENRILRSRLGKRINPTEAEKTKLMRAARPVGSAIKRLATIVTPRTFQRWFQEEREGKFAKPPEEGSAGEEKRGNRKPQEIHDLVLSIRKETGWGGGRIKGELFKLGYKDIGRTTINNILRKHGFKPEPPGNPDSTWANFLHRHTTTLWACDFFTKPILTIGGWVDVYVLFFIHLKTRRVHVLGMTTNPNNEWMKQQARNLCVFFADGKIPPKYIIYDADTKFTRDFRKLLKQNGIKAVRIGPRSPNMNAVAERFVKTVKEECLSHFITFSESHLRHLLMTFLNYYHTKRTHRGLDYLTPEQVENGETPATVDFIERSELVRKTELGGVLKWYERQAA